MAPAISKDEVVIVTKHKGMVDWLAQQGVEGTVMERVSIDDIRGKIVVGSLPDRMNKFARMVIRVDVPNVPQGVKGHEMTCEDMVAYDATMYYYVVRKLVLKKPSKKKDGENGLVETIASAG